MIRRVLFMLIAGATALLLILIGMAAFLFWPLVTSAHSTSQQTSTPTVTTTTATPTPKSTNGVAQMLKQYAPDVKTQIAQGLKLTPEQLTTQLRSGKTLTDVAKAQGVSATQLQTVIKNAVETGLKPAVDNGTITQQQLDKLAKRYAGHPALLDKLLGGKAAKKVPAATPTPQVQ